MSYLYKKVINGDVRATAKLLRMLDDNDSQGLEELKQLYSYTGHSHIIGITGSPGAGKSTLTSAIIEEYRKNGKTVGVIAIDPTSPFSGGAILGDRIRMQEHYNDSGVFIRSVATRGHLGGLSNSVWKMVKVLDAMGKDIIIVETVGVGQDEVEIVELAHTSVVVLVPGLGDDIQAIKAGILEIADIFVINKADRDGVIRLENELKFLLEMFPVNNEWKPPVIKTVANKNKGIDKLISEVSSHLNKLKNDKLFNKKLYRQIEREVEKEITDRLLLKIKKDMFSSKEWKLKINEILNKNIDPYSFAGEIVKKITK